LVISHSFIVPISIASINATSLVQTHDGIVGPAGRLVCLEWLTDKPASEGGAPWFLPPKVYKCHLQHPGEELPYDKDGDLKEADITEQSNSTGLESVAHFQPKRTFQRKGMMPREMLLTE